MLTKTKKLLIYFFLTIPILCSAATYHVDNGSIDRLVVFNQTDTSSEQSTYAVLRGGSLPTCSVEGQGFPVIWLKNDGGGKNQHAVLLTAITTSKAVRIVIDADKTINGKCYMHSVTIYHS